eukprot:PhM_4_TR13817/c1_g1_i1/m.18946
MFSRINPGHWHLALSVLASTRSSILRERPELVESASAVCQNSPHGTASFRVLSKEKGIKISNSNDNINDADDTTVKLIKQLRDQSVVSWGSLDDAIKYQSNNNINNKNNNNNTSCSLSQFVLAS